MIDDIREGVVALLESEFDRYEVIGSRGGLGYDELVGKTPGLSGAMFVRFSTASFGGKGVYGSSPYEDRIVYEIVICERDEMMMNESDVDLERIISLIKTNKISNRVLYPVSLRPAGRLGAMTIWVVEFYVVGKALI